MRYNIISLVVIFSICLGLCNADIVKDGLIANFSFDQSTIVGDNVTDLAGNYNSKMIGKPTIVPGKYNEAIEFNGKDNYLDMTVMQGFGSKLNTFSIDFWIKTTSTPDWTTLFKTLSNDVTMAWAIDLNRTATPAWAYAKGNTHFYIRDNGGKAFAPEISANIYNNSWHHIAWVVGDANSNTCIIYVDGKVQEINNAIAQSPINYIEFQHPLYLGAANNRGAIERYCPASVDEFRIYTKALTQNEVLNNMSTGAGVEKLGKIAQTWGNIKHK
jgi:hypothetical protein